MSRRIALAGLNRGARTGRSLLKLSWMLSLAILCGRGEASGGESEKTGIAESLRPFVDRGSLAGAVALVGDKEKILDVEAVGFADIEAKRALKPDALFWIASMSKPMTAAALMMLVDDGKLALDDPVEKYLPEFRGQSVVVEKTKDRLVLKPASRPITVRNILSHTSGLVFHSPIENKFDELSLREGAITYALSPLRFEPGTKYEYCNGGINTAGRLIEVISGMPYEDYMYKRLFEPLGMKDTTFRPDAERLSRLARSYKPASTGNGLEAVLIDQLTYPLSDPKRKPLPAGGLFSTAEDVYRFCRMILNGGTWRGKRYVSESAVRAMTSTQTGDLLNGGKGEHGYGLGWSTSRKARENSVLPGPCGHGGAYATNMTIDPDRGLIAVFMVQHAGFPNSDGPKILAAFTKAATEKYGE